MSWRSIQLGQELCDQDKIILDLFQNKQVKYVGIDREFRQRLNTSTTAKNLVLVLNQNQWCSDIVKACQQHLDSTIDKFYIGINRYIILGNDTNRNVQLTGQHGNDMVEFVSSIVSEQGFTVTKYGVFDNDLGRYFNFVQPLTWVYGTKATNKSN